jgi:predicted GNAT family N-acyltransferase
VPDAECKVNAFTPLWPRWPACRITSGACIRSSLAFKRLTETDRKGLPAYPVPAVRIGRLATSVSARGQGLGALLLQNALKRILQARNTLGVHAVIVEAKDPAAEGFYRKYGFRLCDPNSRQLYLPLGAE